MAETLKQTQDKLQTEIARLINQAAKETDIAKKAALKSKAKELNNQLKQLKEESGLEKNLSVVEKAKQELERLNQLDPNTPGLAPLKKAQEDIIGKATKAGLPKPQPKVEKKPEPKVKPKAEVVTEEAVTKPKPKPSAKPKPSTVVPAGFNVGTFRAADEASMAKANKTGTKTATGEEDINAIYTLAKSKYGNVDSIFLYDKELKELLIEAVGDPTTTVGDMEPDEFLRRLNATDWAIRNAGTYAVRDAQRREYNETLDKYNRQLEMADTQDKKDEILSKIGQLKTTSAYARGLASAKAYIEATASGLTGTMSPERLDAFVKRMYDSANDKDPNIINRELSALISYKPGSTLGGQIGADLTDLRATAAANGFNLDTSFGSNINDWLQRLAKGESIETFKNTIRGAAKLGLPDKVANLLDQGLDLKDIYAPYRNVMASVLEVAPDSIGLDDKTLRMAIGPEKEVSLYDFQRMLRKDQRWQYTNNAREEASDSVLKVLKDFGFQG
jgi:hypothetical protein